MSFWGNDIVALNEFSFETNHHLDRWLGKVCTEKEKEWLFSSRRPEQTRWRLWTFKESAYKVLMKCGVPPFQNVRRIEILPDGSLLAKKMHFKASLDDYQLWGYSVQNKDWVHSICSNQPFNEEVYHADVISYDTKRGASKAIREQVEDQLKKEYGIKIKSIAQSTENIPIISCENPEISIDLSLTHHLPYSAFVYHIHRLT